MQSISKILDISVRYCTSYILKSSNNQAGWFQKLVITHEINYYLFVRLALVWFQSQDTRQSQKAR